MTDEPQGQESPETTSDIDSRFEVKWRKKESGSTRPVALDPEPAVSPADLQEKLAAAEKRADELSERWQRAAADLANLRRRTEQDRGEMEKFAAMMVVAELLPVLDNFERALATIPGNLSMLTWIQGVMLIERHFRALLEHLGVAPIEARGTAFNPALHEAIGERPTDEAAPGIIIQVYQQGYTMHGRVIRPALVEIATAPVAAPEEPTTAPEASSTDDEQAVSIAETAEEKNTGP